MMKVARCKEKEGLNERLEKPETIRTGLSGAWEAFAWRAVKGMLSTSGGPVEGS